jgi:general stress protein YciG
MKQPTGRGFASLPPERLRKVSKKGGQKVSKNKTHMSKIGKKGAEKAAARKRELRELRNKNPT